MTVRPGPPLLALAALFASAVGALALDPVPEGFARRVEQGWLPPCCAPSASQEAPRPLLRQWAPIRAGRRVRVLFLVPSFGFPGQYQFEAQSVARSFDLDADIVPLVDARRPDKQDPEAMNLLRHFLGTRRYDVVALTGAWLTALPADCAARVTELVREGGVGFVHSVPGAPPEGAQDGLDALLPTATDPAKPRVKSWQVIPTQAAHPLTGGSDFARMSWVCDVDATATPEATVLLRSERPERVLAAAAARGNGRVVSYNCCLEEMVFGRPFCPPQAAPFVPEEDTGKVCRWLQGTEPADQFYAWLARALRWASPAAEPTVSVRQATVAPQESVVAVELANSSAEPSPGVLRVMVRSPYNTIALSADKPFTLAAGKVQTEQIALPDTGYAGRHLVDVFVLDASQRVWDWWSFAWERPGAFTAALAPDFTLHLPDQDLKLRLKVAGLPGGQPFTVRTELSDLDGRLLWDQATGQTAPVGGPTEAAVPLNLAQTGISTALANVRVTVTAASQSVELRDQLFVRQDPRWDAFHIMAYDGYYEEPFSFAVRASVLRGMGHDTLLASWPSPPRLRTDAETGMRVLPNNIAPFCGYRPEGVQYVTNWLRRFSPVLYELQDEPELQYTAAAEAPFDAEPEMARFRAFLKGKYGTIEALNGAWGTEAAGRRAAGSGFDVISVLPADARFRLDPHDEGVKQHWFARDLDDSAWAPIRTGAPWEQQGYDYDGFAWYRLRFVVPEAARGRQLSLAFGGADEEAWVYLNGRPLGERSTASTGKLPAELWDKSFEIKLPEDLAPGQDNLLVVRVHDQAQAGGLYKPITLVAPTARAASTTRPSGYADWSQVQRFLWHEVLDSGNWTPWFDSRRERDEFFLEKFGACSAAVREIEPDRLASVNYRSLETFSGINLRAFTRRLGASSMYTDFVRDNRSAASLSYLEFGSRWAAPAMSCIGYSAPPLAELQGKRIAHEAWDAVRHGAKMIAWFYPPDYLNKDLTPNDEGRVIERVNRALLAGPGPVAAASEPLREGVFIYYPRTVFYADTLACLLRKLAANPGGKPAELTGLGPFDDQIPNGFVPHLRALGYQFEFGDEDDLTAEHLRDTRVVLLSHVICLGERELEVLGEFVRRGGCVIAEAGTGRRDASGRVYAQTPEAFRRLFGVQRSAPNLSPAVTVDGIVPAEARRADWLPATLGAGYANGRAFFLDFPVPATADGYQAVKRTLERAGIRPTFELRDNLVPAAPPVTVDVYGVTFCVSNGLNASLAVRQLGKGTYLYLTGDNPSAPGRFSLLLPAKRQVYEMVAGKALGVLGTIEGTLAYGEARVFALSPSPVVRFTAAGSSRCPLGEKVPVRFTLATADGSPGDRVVRLEYRGHGKGMVPALPRTLVLKGGQGEWAAVLPLNGAPGPASISATDLASGAQCQASFEGVVR